MSEPIILADSISEVPHLAAFDAMWAQRLNGIELEQLFVYIIDTITPEALPYLAEQFDVLGDKGYRLATTDAQRRQIIKQAIELKRYLGTVWAVKEAIRSVGYANATLVEGVNQGTPAIDWAKFRVVVDLGNTAGLDGNTATELAKLINSYKNVRSKLLDISYVVSVTDTLPPLDDTLYYDFYQPDIIEDLGWKGRFYNGAFNYDGSQPYNDGNDTLTVTII